MKKTARGRLFTRGKNRIYYLQFYIKGKQIVKALRNESGGPIKDKREAEKVRDVLLAPYLANDQATLRELALSAVQTSKEKAEIAEDMANPPLMMFKAWKAYLKDASRHDSGERTLKDYEGYFKHFADWQALHYPEIRHMREITTEKASEYADFLKEKGVSANTFNKHIGFLRLMYKTLKGAIRALENPFENIRPLKLRPDSRRELSMEELMKILRFAPNDLALLLGLGTFTGMRLGDCCTLRWGEIDLVRGLIRRIPNKTASRGGKPVVIGIPPWLYDRLNEIPSESRTGYLFPHWAGTYLDLNKRPSITRLIQDHFEACGIQTHRPNTGKGTGKRAVVEVGFHSLRHTYVSLHAEKGTPLAVIQCNVGHGNAAMTRNYLHVSESMAREVANALILTDHKTTPPILIQDDSLERQKLKTLADTAEIDRVKRAIKILETKKS